MKKQRVFHCRTFSDIFDCDDIGTVMSDIGTVMSDIGTVMSDIGTVMSDIGTVMSLWNKRCLFHFTISVFYGHLCNKIFKENQWFFNFIF